MRVITGSARGRKLGELSGSETRPTYDRVKEGIFNVIQFDIEGRRVLDLFAGTGQLGIECLSRGAQHCVFVDQRRDAVRLIGENLKLTGLEQGAEVHMGDAISYLGTTREKFHLIFLDPPYDSGLLEAALKKIMSIDILAENGIIICESRQDHLMPEAQPPFVRGREYRYGKTKVVLYRRLAETAAEACM